MLMITRRVNGTARSVARSHSPPNSSRRSAYSSAIASMAGWRPLTAAGLNQSLVTLRSFWCASPWMWTSVRGSSMPIACNMSYWRSGPGADFSVFQNTSLRRETSNTSAWVVMAQNAGQPSASTRITGSSRRISAATRCHCSMSAYRSGEMKISPRGSVAILGVGSDMLGPSCSERSREYGPEPASGSPTRGQKVTLVPAGGREPCTGPDLVLF